MRNLKALVDKPLMWRGVEIATKLLLERCGRAMCRLSKALDCAIFENMVVNTPYELDSINICTLKQLISQTAILRTENVIYQLNGTHLAKMLSNLFVVTIKGVVYAIEELRQRFGGFANNEVITLALATMMGSEAL